MYLYCYKFILSANVLGYLSYSTVYNLYISLYYHNALVHYSHFYYINGTLVTLVLSYYEHGDDDGDGDDDDDGDDNQYVMIIHQHTIIIML